MALPGDETILAAMTDSRTASDAVTIRRATDDDTELVIVGRLRFLCDVRGLTPDGLSDEFLTANRRFIERTHGRSFHSWLATTDRDVVGIVSLVIFDAPPRPEERRDADGYVVNMHVVPEHRRRGIGRRLIERCMRDAEAEGVRRFTLHATADGRPLYESLGFVDEPGWMNRYA